MVGKILTPKAIWKNFLVEDKINSKQLEKNKIDGVVTTSIIIEGREVKDGKVQIYAELYSASDSIKGPAIILLEDFSICQDKSLVKELIGKGYVVMSVDIAGFYDEKDNYTVYPPSRDYANYEKAKDKLLTVEKDASHTCWYEWSAVIRYALKYLKSLPGVTKVGAIGIGMVATALWQVAGTDELLDSAVFTYNAGWLGYSSVHKFAGTVEPQFSDDKYMFIAGIDPQSYATHVKCPTLILSTTNNTDFDCDRAFDTASRMQEGVYSVVHYSQNQVYKINDEGYNDLTLFFDKFLKGNKLELPGDCDIKCELEKGKLVIEVGGDSNGLKSVDVFIAEQMADPTYRCWQKLNTKKKNDGKYITKFVPFNKSELAVMYATLKYANGFTVCTNVISKKFTEQEIDYTFKNTIIYSSRIENAHSIFVNADTKDEINALDRFTKTSITKKKGPMGIEGISHAKGILTFMSCCEKHIPKDDAIMMIDVYSKQEAELIVTLTADYFGAKTEYIARVSVRGGDVWHNVKIEKNKFKTAEGRTIKDYSTIQAITVNVEGSEYLINNALWI